MFGVRGIFAILMACFSTMPIILVSIAGVAISPANLLFPIFLLAWLAASSAMSKEFRLTWSIVFGFFWLISALTASLFGLIRYSDDQVWFSAVLSYLPRIVIFLIMFASILLWSSDGVLGHGFVKGVIIGAILNVAWAVIEGIYFYSTGDTLNERLFSNYLSKLPENRQFLTVIAGGMIRASGFNVDPAHLGVLIPILAIYGIVKRSVSLIFLAILGLVFSGSTTALMVTMLSIVTTVGKFGFRVEEYKPLIAKMVIIIFFGLIAIFGSSTIYDYISSNVLGFYERVTINYINSTGEDPRSIYHSHLLRAILNNGIGWTLIGSGVGVTSYAYVSDPSILSLLPESYSPYDPESTYITYLFGLGIVGFFAYLGLLVSLIKVYRRRIHDSNFHLALYSMLCAIFYAGFLYHYTFTLYQVIVLIIALRVNRVSRPISLSRV